MKRLVLVALWVAACSGSTSATTAAPTPPTSAGTTTVPAATIAVPPTASTTTEAPRLELHEPQVIYLLMAAPVGDPTLIPVWRDATSPQGLAGAIETLLLGPTPAERLGVPAISTDIPSEAILLGADVVNGLATVDLSAAFFTADDPPDARLAQVVYTATRFADVESVTFRIEGEPFTGLPGGAARLMFRDLQPPVFVDEPAYGGPAAQPGRLRGEARIAAGGFTVTLRDAEDLTIAELAVPRDGEGWVPFDVPLPYFVDVDQAGELAIDTADGVVDLTYPLQLLLPSAGTCSAAGVSTDPVDQGLPPAVEATRQSVIAAATACDFAALAALGGPDFTFSFGPDTDPITYWQGQEAAGIPVTRLMVQLLNTPPVFDTDFYVPTYLWPAAFRAAPTPEDFDLLEGILPAEDLALYREFNEYLDLRLGISQEGSWDFAVAGDSDIG